MKKVKLALGICAILLGLAAITLVFQSEKTLVTHPKGLIAHQQLRLIAINVLLMLAILLPTLFWLLATAWKYRSNNPKAEFNPKKFPGLFGQTMLWIAPALVVAVMSVITWYETHALDPYKPIASEIPEMEIQVVAINWKWLFIYPEQGIATVNFVQFPERTPIKFSLAADNSPMNSFWIPQLSGQIYCMTGMITPLHIMADGPGEYSGKAAEINGNGYAGMRFVAKSSTKEDFETWVQGVKNSPLQLNHEEYDLLAKPSEKHPITYYSHVADGLFNKIVMKYMHPNTEEK